MANITATLQDFGETAVGGFLIVTLCNFGSQIPRVAGSSVIVDAGPTSYPANAEGAVSITLVTNDTITPAGTYYCIAVANSNGDMLQVNLYQFFGLGPFDLSSTLPIDPNIGVPSFQYATTDIWIVLPSSAQDRLTLAALKQKIADLGLDFNLPAAPTIPPNIQVYSAPPGNTYTLSQTPFLDVLIGLYHNGLLLVPGVHYSVAGTTITLTFNTSTGDNLCAVYVANVGAVSKL